MPNEYIQHRGLASDQEFPNSFEALQQLHAATIEVDLFLIDGQLVVMHNSDVFMLNNGEVKTRMGHLSQEEVEVLTWDQIEQMHVTGRITGVEGEKVPVLRDYIMNALHHSDKLEIELRGSSTTHVVALAEAVIREIHRMRVVGLFKEQPYAIEKQLALYSLSVEALETVREVSAELEEHIPYGLAWVSLPEHTHDKAITENLLQRVGWTQTMTENVIEEWNLRGVTVAKEIGCDFIAIHHEAISDGIIEATHANDLALHAWVVNDHEEAVALLKRGVDKIITEQ